MRYAPLVLGLAIGYAITSLVLLFIGAASFIPYPGPIVFTMLCLAILTHVVETAADRIVNAIENQTAILEDEEDEEFSSAST